jgi:hypothetical protein
MGTKLKRASRSRSGRFEFSTPPGGGDYVFLVGVGLYFGACWGGVTRLVGVGVNRWLGVGRLSLGGLGRAGPASLGGRRSPLVEFDVKGYSEG